jgi:hypothetical protein
MIILSTNYDEAAIENSDHTNRRDYTGVARAARPEIAAARRLLYGAVRLADGLVGMCIGARSEMVIGS